MPSTVTFPLITLMGPTASGKTAIAANLAFLLKGVVISGDSRQVYRGMDIGTGKDLLDYKVQEVSVPYFLIDICEPGEHYNVFRYQKDFFQVFDSIFGKPCILCGGSGLYIESVIGRYHLPQVPKNEALRKSLKDTSLDNLVNILESYGPVHNTTDSTNKRRLIRAIEIAEYQKSHPQELTKEVTPIPLGPIYVIDIPRDVRRSRISKRLEDRLSEGMIEEVERLLSNGLTPRDLIYYGLEYRYVTQYVIGELSYTEMKDRLEIAIHQFAKRQMTWLRGMTRRGFQLTYFTPHNDPQETALSLLKDLKTKGYPVE